MNITQNGKVSNSYTYSMNGQIASVDIAGKTESFIWDGLALIKCGTTEYVYEPAVTGGNPILANGKAMFNDMLGNTLGIIGEKGKLTGTQGTSFGSGEEKGFFTGKPHVQGLGYTFLFRNYRSELGKWQTADPLGYPDGWNNLAYCNNKVTDCIDWQGTLTQTVDGIKYTSDGWRITGVTFLPGLHGGDNTGTIASVTWEVTVNWECLTCHTTGSYHRTETITVDPVDWTRYPQPQGPPGFSSILGGIGNVISSAIPALNYYIVTTEGTTNIVNSRPSVIPYVKEHTVCE